MLYRVTGAGVKGDCSDRDVRACSLPALAGGRELLHILLPLLAHGARRLPDRDPAPLRVQPRELER